MPHHNKPTIKLPNGAILLVQLANDNGMNDGAQSAAPNDPMAQPTTTVPVTPMAAMTAILPRRPSDHSIRRDLPQYFTCTD